MSCTRKKSAEEEKGGWKEKLEKGRRAIGRLVVHVAEDNSLLTVATVAELQVMLITPICLL